MADTPLLDEAAADVTAMIGAALAHDAAALHRIAVETKMPLVVMRLLAVQCAAALAEQVPPDLLPGLLDALRRNMITVERGEAN